MPTPGRGATRGRGAGCARPPRVLARAPLPVPHEQSLRAHELRDQARDQGGAVFLSAASLVRLVGVVCCDQNDAWVCECNFIDKRSLEPGCERVPIPADPGGEERVFRLVEVALDRRRGRLRIRGGATAPGDDPCTTFRDATDEMMQPTDF